MLSSRELCEKVMLAALLDCVFYKDEQGHIRSSLRHTPNPKIPSQFYQISGLEAFYSNRTRLFNFYPPPNPEQSIVVAASR